MAIGKLRISFHLRLGSLRQQPAVEATIQRQFRMKRDAEFVAVKHTHNFVAQACDRRTGHGPLFKPRCTDEDTREPLFKGVGTRRSDFQGLMRKAILATGEACLNTEVGASSSTSTTASNDSRCLPHAFRAIPAAR